jgi:hypothetical protein
MAPVVSPANRFPQSRRNRRGLLAASSASIKRRKLPRR